MWLAILAHVATLAMLAPSTRVTRNLVFQRLDAQLHLRHRPLRLGRSRDDGGELGVDFRFLRQAARIFVFACRYRRVAPIELALRNHERAGREFGGAGAYGIGYGRTRHGHLFSWS